MSDTKAPDLAGKPPDRRKLIAVVYADMAGYSRLIGLDDAGTLNRLRTLRANLIDPAIDEHGGRIVQTGGGSLLIVFDSIDGAVRCAMQVQQRVPDHDGDYPPDQIIRFRVGINIGDAIADVLTSWRRGGRKRRWLGWVSLRSVRGAFRRLWQATPICLGPIGSTGPRLVTLVVLGRGGRQC